MPRSKSCASNSPTSPRKSSSTFRTRKTNATVRPLLLQVFRRSASCRHQTIDSPQPINGSMNPYHTLVHQYAELLHTGKRAPFGGFAPLDRPKTDADSPRALIFSPHPDDECIIGAQPLRIMREAH